MSYSRSFTYDQGAFEAPLFAAVPGAWRGRVRRLFERKKKSGLAVANGWLRDTGEDMRALRVPLDLSDGELCELAAKLAREAFSLAEPLAGIWYGAEQLRQRMAAFCSRYGIGGPGGTVTDTGAISRMTCPLWWRRKLRASQSRAIEAQAIKLGYVHRRAEIYASDLTVNRRSQQKARNRAALENTRAVNTVTGDVFTLAELADKAVSNPRIRRGELMTRIAGFEAVAVGMGHAGEFWTATAPSRFHQKKTDKAGAVLDNPKFTGETPRECQQYLVKTWAKFRAAAARRGLKYYGFRIAEPHHDATPHWHLLLFVDPVLSAGRSAVGRLRALFRRYFLADSKGEQGAKKNRCEFVAIDWKRGSAAGYIAKYVSKNIDGYQVQADLEGENLSAVTGSQRVEAWASAWGIRQFQQVGGPPVGAWRELRRMAESEEHSPEIFEAISAADTANFARYVELQGGPLVARKCLAFRVAYTREGERWNAAKGWAEPAPLTRYWELSPGAVFGVRDCVRDRAHCSRFHQWEIKRTSGARLSSAGTLQGGDQQRAGSPFGFGVGVGPDFSAPWSSVNNCTREGGGNYGGRERIGHSGSGVGEIGGEVPEFGGGDAVAGVGALAAAEIGRVGKGLVRGNRSEWGWKFERGAWQWDGVS